MVAVMLPSYQRQKGDRRNFTHFIENASVPFLQASERATIQVCPR